MTGRDRAAACGVCTSLSFCNIFCSSFEEDTVWREGASLALQPQLDLESCELVTLCSAVVFIKCCLCWWEVISAHSDAIEPAS